MPFLLDLAWRDLRDSGRTLWVFGACLLLGVALVAAGGGRSRLVELQSTDSNEPLVGQLRLEPPLPLAERLGRRDGAWGVALDPVLAGRLGLRPGDWFAIGDG